MSGCRKDKAIGRHQLADYASKKTGISRSDCYAVVAAAIEGLVSELGQGHRVELRGFCGFTFRTKQGRFYGNLKMIGEDVEIEVPRHTALRFSVAKNLRSKVARLKI